MIAEPSFFFTVIVVITAIIAIMWKPGLRQIPILHLQAIFLWIENVMPLRVGC